MQVCLVLLDGCQIRSESATISAISLTSAAPSRSVSLMPSSIIVRQNGHAVPISFAPAASRSSVRRWLILVPNVSSSHIRPPPAPQHNP